MTDTVPQDSDKPRVQSNEGASRAKSPGQGGKSRGDKKQTECPPTISASRGMTMPFCGGVEAYNERSLRVKYCSQEVQTSFYESNPSAEDPLGSIICQGLTEDSGNARANIPYASKERNLRDISRVLLERIPGTQGFWRVESSDRLKTTERPHRRSSLSHAHHKFSAEYHRKRRLCIQNRSAGCVLYVLIHPDSRKYMYLRFALENKVYQFRVLPFGLNTAPQVFTHLGHTVAAYLHRLGYW